MFDENRRAKLVDFGISITNEVDDERRRVNDFTCSLVCAPPEVVLKCPYDPEKADIWSLGVTILWLARGAMPWHFDSPEELRRMITSGSYIVPRGMDSAVERIVRGMLAVEPKERVFPTMQEIAALESRPSHGRVRVKKSQELAQFQSFTTLRGSYGMMRKGTAASQSVPRKKVAIAATLLKTPILTPSTRKSIAISVFVNQPLGPLSPPIEADSRFLLEDLLRA